jgi:hypothetical protein
MQMSTLRLFLVLSFACALMVSVSAAANAQYSNTGTTAKSTSMKEPTLTATLVDPEKKAKEKAATVEVKVTGIEIIDPAKVNETPHAGQGHFHYQLDGGPIIATTAPKLSFHELTPGDHKLVVTSPATITSRLVHSRRLTLRFPS